MTSSADVRPPAERCLGVATFAFTGDGDDADALKDSRVAIVGAFHRVRELGKRHARLCEYVDLGKSHRDRFVVSSEFFSLSLEEQVRLGGLAQPAPPPLERIALDLVDALAFLARNHVTHRNLGLENVLVDSSGRVKLADYGLFAMTDANRRSPFVCGNPHFLPPELLCGGPNLARGADASWRADAWALGVLLVFLARGGAGPASWHRSTTAFLAEFERFIGDASGGEEVAAEAEAVDQTPTPTAPAPAPSPTPEADLAAKYKVDEIAPQADGGDPIYVTATPLEAPEEKVLSSATPFFSSATPARRAIVSFAASPSPASSACCKGGQRMCLRCWFDVDTLDVSPELRDVVARCLTLDPSERASADHLLGHAAFAGLEADGEAEAAATAAAGSPPYISDLYYLWQLGGGTAEGELAKAGRLQLTPPVMRFPRIVLVGEQVVFEQDKSSVTAARAYYRRWVPVSLDLQLEVAEKEDEEEEQQQEVDGEAQTVVEASRRQQERLQAAMEERRATVVRDGAVRLRALRTLLVDVPATRDEIAALGSFPVVLRAEIWSALLDVRTDLYERFATALPGGEDAQLDRDIPRCHQYHELIGSHAGRRQLRNVLKTWLRQDKQHQYWQGLDSVAAPFVALYWGDEARAFGALSAMIRRNLANMDMGVLHGRMRHMTWLMSFYEPRLSVHLDTIGFGPQLYAVPWFFTLFSHILPLREVLLLWDALLVREAEFVAYVGFAVVAQLRERLLQLDFNGCIDLFGNSLTFDVPLAIDAAQRAWADSVRMCPHAPEAAHSPLVALVPGDDEDDNEAMRVDSLEEAETLPQRWLAKQQKRRRHAHEHNKDPDWFRHKKHVLICSWAGRPIFTRYGDDTALAGYMGVISAIISNFERHGDAVRSIRAGESTIVFLLKGPIYLVSVSQTGETVPQLRKQLGFVHDQIVSVLTGGVRQILENKPSYDLRNLMGGVEHLLTDIIAESNRNPAFLLDAAECLALPKAARAKVGTILRKARTRNLVYAVLLADTKLVNVAAAKERPLTTHDLLLLANFVTNSQSLRASESWTPVCLPDLSDQGFVYAYVCFLADDVSLSLIASSSDDFYELKEAKLQIVRALQQNDGLLAEIQAAVRAPRLTATALDTSVPEFRHFLYKNVSAQQFVSPEATVPFTTKHSRKELFRRYQHIHARMRNQQTYFEVGQSVTTYAWHVAGEFELYASFSPLVSREAATTACNRALRWIKREEEDLFLLHPPLF